VQLPDKVASLQDFKSSLFFYAFQNESLINREMKPDVFLILTFSRFWLHLEYF